MNTYHCSIYELSSPDDEQQRHDFHPFRSQAEMTRFTGLPLEAWLQRQKALAKLEKVKRGFQRRTFIMEEYA